MGAAKDMQWAAKKKQPVDLKAVESGPPNPADPKPRVVSFRNPGLSYPEPNR